MKLTTIGQLTKVRIPHILKKSRRWIIKTRQSK